jgi:hypothetical protein
MILRHEGSKLHNDLGEHVSCEGFQWTANNLLCFHFFNIPLYLQACTYLLARMQVFCNHLKSDDISAYEYSFFTSQKAIQTVGTFGSILYTCIPVMVPKHDQRCRIGATVNLLNTHVRGGVGYRSQSR